MNYYGTSYWASTDSLSHYGILGMKWGVRRYQNKDGSLTAAGKNRYGDSSQKPERFARYKRGRNIAEEHTNAYFKKQEELQKRSSKYRNLQKDNERLTSKYDLDNKEDHSLDSKLVKTEREWAAQKRWQNADSMDSMDEEFNKKAKEYADKLITEKHGDMALSDMEHYQSVNRGIAAAGAILIVAGMTALSKRI